MNWRYFGRTLFLAFALVSQGLSSPTMADESTSPNPPVAPASASASATPVAASAPASTATVVESNLPNEVTCPSAEVVFIRVREAAHLNAAEADAIGGGAAGQFGEIASNLLGFGGLFGAATNVTAISAYKKLDDAIAADPCGEKGLDAFPKPTRKAYEAYRKKLKK